MKNKKEILINNNNYSYWENQTFFNTIDLIVIGSGIVGLSSAISYKEKYPKSKVLVLERGIFPTGASTKNAGFACFGSVSELLADLKNGDENSVFETVHMRINGLELLRKRLGDKNIDYNEWGGYELFEDKNKFETCCDSIKELNYKINKISGFKNCYSVVNKKIKYFNFSNTYGLIKNKNEGQINTGLMMQNLIKYAIGKGIIILNSVSVNCLNDIKNKVQIDSSIGVLEARKVIVATNGFANELLKINDLKPARAQVLITKPIENLKLKGTFHLDEGYYYFRNIGNRVLFGGGRNLDFEKETTTEFELNSLIQRTLEQKLESIILPKINFKIDYRWCGIMGVGIEKKPIINFVSPNVICAVRMGGMGIAIGSAVGEIAVSKIT